MSVLVLCKELLKKSVHSACVLTVCLTAEGEQLFCALASGRTPF